MHLLMKLLLLIMQVLYEIHTQKTALLLFVKLVIHQNVNKMSSVNYCAA